MSHNEDYVRALTGAPLDIKDRLKARDRKLSGRRASAVEPDPELDVAPPPLDIETPPTPPDPELPPFGADFSVRVAPALPPLPAVQDVVAQSIDDARHALLNEDVVTRFGDVVVAGNRRAQLALYAVEAIVSPKAGPWLIQMRDGMRGVDSREIAEIVSAVNAQAQSVETAALDAEKKLREAKDVEKARDVKLVPPAGLVRNVKR